MRYDMRTTQDFFEYHVNFIGFLERWKAARKVPFPIDLKHMNT